MFTQTLSIEPRLSAVVEALENHEPGMRVVSARVYKTPYLELEVAVDIQRPRPFDVLEEFVLRAANELRPQPSKAGLAKLLGLDPLFLDATVANLVALEALKNNTDGPIVLTAKGAKFYSQGSVPQPPERKSTRLVYQCLTAALTVPHKSTYADNNVALLPGFEMKYWTAFAAQASEAVTLENIIAVSAQAGLNWHEPAAGKYLSRFEITEAPGPFAYEYYGVLVIQDIGITDPNVDNVSIRVIDLQSGREVLQLTQRVEQWLQTGKAALKDFFGEAPMDVESGAVSLQNNLSPTAVIARELYAGQLAIKRQTHKPQSVKTQAVGQPLSTGVVELLRDSEVRTRFLGLLEKAAHIVIIVMPWITDDVVDAEFRQRLAALASRNVRILLGWGTAEHRDREERQPSPELLDELHQIKSPDGLPGVITCWLGGQYGKDVLVDNHVHLSGSPNWLSYGGEHQLGGETIYVITSPDSVQKASAYIESLFVTRMDEEWQKVSQESESAADELGRICITLIALRQYDDAIQRILTLAAEATHSALTLTLFQAVITTVAAQPIAFLFDANFFDTLLIALPEISRTIVALPPEIPNNTQLVADLRNLIKRYAEEDSAGLIAYLDGAHDIWEQIGLLPVGTSGAQYVSELPQAGTARPVKKKKK